MENNKLVPLKTLDQQKIEECIYNVRGKQVMLDSDIATFFGTETRRLNQQMNRNKERFPEDFCFKLNSLEFKILKSQNATSSYGGKRHCPYVFTEHGILALAGVLKSDIAAKMSVEIVRKFVQMRQFILENGEVLVSLAKIQNRQIEFEDKTNKKFEEIFKLLNHMDLPKQALLKDGEFYNAYEFVTEIISKAQKSILLIDPYFDSKGFTFLKHRKNNVDIIICLSKDSKLTDNETEIFQSQYGPIKIIKNDLFHDRFLIVDSNLCYLLGTSLNYMGKRIFAINQIDNLDIISFIINQVNNSLRLQNVISS